MLCWDGIDIVLAMREEGRRTEKGDAVLLQGILCPTHSFRGLVLPLLTFGQR